MIIEHYGIKIDTGPFQFGNEHDIMIRDEMVKLNNLLRPMKVTPPRQDEKVKEIMRRIQGIVEMKQKSL